MSTYRDISAEEVTFRGPYLGYYTALALVLSMGAFCLVLATRVHAAWLAGVGLVVYAGALLASHYVMGPLALRGYDLVIRSGRFTVREVTIPVWEVRPLIIQSLLGRLLDYGTFTVRVDGKTFAVTIGHMRALRRLLATRRLRMLELADQRTLVTLTSRPEVHARELVEP